MKKENLNYEEDLLFLQLKPFPSEVFPELGEEFIESAAKALGCPSDFLGAGILSAISTAIGNSLELKYSNTFIVGGVTYIVIIGGVGQGKTPAINQSLSPIMALQNEQYKQYKIKKEEYEIQKRTQTYEKSGEKELPKPHLKEIVVTDITQEALYEVLAKNPRGVVQLYDELAGFFKSMNQYRPGADVEHRLSMHTRTPIKVNRKGLNEPIFIPKPFCNIIGGIQPDIIDAIIQNKADNGFFERFLFVNPKPVFSVDEEKEVPQELIDAYNSIIMDIFSSLSKNETQQILLSTEAKERLDSWYKSLKLKTQSPSFPGNLKAYYAKTKGHILTLCLLLHVIHWACSKNRGSSIELLINENIVLKAITLMEYFISNYEKTIHFSDNSYENRNMIKVIEHIQEKDHKDDLKEYGGGKFVTAQELNKAKIFGRKTNISMIRGVFSRMVSEGYGVLHSIQNSNKTYTDIFVIND